MKTIEIIQYIKSLYPNKELIALHEPVFFGNEKKYVADCIDSTFVSSVGKYVNTFEQLVTDFTGCTRAVACVNGTNALHLALLLVGVEKNDEVITQPLTFIATANAISYCGAYPVFIDVDKETMGLSPAKIESWLQSNAQVTNGVCYNKQTKRRIKACVPMHTFGYPVLITDTVRICSEWHIDLVEDAAESLGSFYKEKHTGTFAQIGVLSFNGNKTITTGGGGMLLFNDIELAARAKHLTTQAKTPHRWEFNHDAIGYNYRLPNINSALGCAQMENLNSILKNKRQTARFYKEFFAATDYVFFDEPINSTSNFWLNALVCKNLSERNTLLTETNDNGVMTRPIWELMNKLPMFQHCQCGNIENAQWFADRVVNIPSGYRV